MSSLAKALALAVIWIAAGGVASVALAGSHRTNPWLALVAVSVFGLGAGIASIGVALTGSPNGAGNTRHQ